MAKQASPPAKEHPSAPAKLPAHGGEPGKRQRLRLFTPNPKTTLQLGAELDGEAPFGFDGVSLSTQGNLYSTIAKRTLLDFLGGAALHSQGILQHWANEALELCTSGDLTALAKKRLFISSGYGSPIETHEQHGKRLQAISPLEKEHKAFLKEMTEFQTRFEHGFLWINGAKALLGITVPTSAEKWGKFLFEKGTWLAKTWKAAYEWASEPEEESESPESKSEGGEQESTASESEPAASESKSARAEQKSTGSESESAGSKSKSEGSEPESADLILRGQDGVVLTSPKDVSILSGSGVKVFTDSSIDLLARSEFSVEAVTEAKVFAGVTTDVQAGAYLELRAGHEVGIASLHGPVDIKGKSIEIGKYQKSGFQAGTEEVELSAEAEIALRAKKIEIGCKAEPHSKEHGKRGRLGKLMEEAGEKLAKPAGWLTEKLSGPEGPPAPQDAAEKVWIEAAKEIKLDSEKEILITANEDEGTVCIKVGAFVVKVTKKKVLLGQASEPANALLSIDEKGRVDLTSQTASVFLNRKAGTLRVNDGSHYVSVSGSGVKVKGTKLQLL